MIVRPMHLPGDKSDDDFIALDAAHSGIGDTVLVCSEGNATRALVGNPSLILADEPTGNLDQANGDQLMELLDQLHGEGATLITVTHNPLYAERASRRIHMLDGKLRPDA